MAGRLLSPRRIVITGASRGIGLEFVQQYLDRGDQVFALARHPEAAEALRDLAARHVENLRVAECDVAVDASVERARRAVAEAWEGVDILINNAATFGGASTPIRDLDLADVKRVFEVNTIGPIRVSRSFLPLLEKGRDPRLVHVTSLMGSVADNQSGGHWAYRMSKAALHMASRNLAHEVGSLGMLSVAISPGWVKTDMGGPNAPLTPRESVADMIRTIDGLGPKHNGGFIDRSGKPLPA